MSESKHVFAESKGLTDDSYEKNLIADSGRIFTTDRPFPVQNARTPPSAYIRVTAPAMAFRPRTGARGLSEVPPRSGGRVIRNIFRRSNGAVHVLDTAQFAR